MHFMIVETFRSEDAKAIYMKARDQGRGMPEGLQSVHSWVSANLEHCFQVVVCDHVAALQSWVAHWSDLIQFEIIPVISGKETSDLLLNNAR